MVSSGHLRGPFCATQRGNHLTDHPQETVDCDRAPNQYSRPREKKKMANLEHLIIRSENPRLKRALCYTMWQGEVEREREVIMRQRQSRETDMYDSGPLCETKFYLPRSTNAHAACCQSCVVWCLMPSPSVLPYFGNKRIFPMRHKVHPFHISAAVRKTSAASDICAASQCGNLDSFGHLHKQAVSGPRRARLPKQDADSWQGVATS